VTTGIVEIRDFPIYRFGLGTVQAYNTVTIKVRVDGEVQKIAFREGQDVHIGDILAQIDPRPYEAQLHQAEADKARDEALLANAKLDLERFSSLAIKEFATRYKVKIRRDGCDDMIAPGKQYCTDMPDRVEYHSHVYDHENGEHFGLCLMYAPSDESGKSGKSGRWSNSKKKLLEAGFQIRQDGGEIPRALENRPRGLAQIDPHFARDDVRERGLAQPRRAEQQHVIERLAARARRLDEDLELAADLLLPDIFGEGAGPQRALELLLLRGGRLGRDQPVGFNAHPGILP